MYSRNGVNGVTKHNSPVLGNQLNQGLKKWPVKRSKLDNNSNG